MSQPTLFDALESAALKESAITKLENCDSFLTLARELARDYATHFGTVNADIVGKMLKSEYDIDSIGPAAGALFRGAEWEFTGQRVLSSRVSNHSREIKVWRLRQ